MSDWRTHRNGLPRTGMYLERVARHRAAKLGYRVIRSRRRRGRDNNDSDYMLVDKASSTILLGAGYTAALETILEFMERPQMVDGPHRGPHRSQ
jgi:hypothetical protein